jgi:hypothetical protein
MQTETDVQNLCRLRAQELGAVLWRNNVGAIKDARGIPVRFGLANDSAKVNEVLKSSDLIGIHMGRFLAVECKEPGWVYSAMRSHDAAQHSFLRLVRQYGGLSGYATHPDDVNAILAGRWGCIER